MPHWAADLQRRHANFIRDNPRFAGQREAVARLMRKFGYGPTVRLIRSLDESSASQLDRVVWDPLMRNR